MLHFKVHTFVVGRPRYRHVSSLYSSRFTGWS